MVNKKIDYFSLRDYIIKHLYDTPKKDMFDYVASYLNYPHDYSTFRRFIYRVKAEIENEEINEAEIDLNLFIDTIKRLKVCNVSYIESEFSCSPKTVYELIERSRLNGYDIIVESGKIIFNTDSMPNVVKIKQLESKDISFGVASDFHFGSKACQITALNEFSKICEHKGVKHVFVPGDILSGNSVYPGHVFDLYAVSADEQINSCLANLPTGFEWYMLGGNHDYSFVKKTGQNPLLVLSSLRNDIHYLGFDSADVPILKNVDVKLWHPSGGVPYSYSYRLQKGIEQVAYSELQLIVRGVKDKPTVRFVLSGHLHIQVQAMFGSIFGAQCGAFEGQTNYLKRKGLVPSIGGYIVHASLGENGLLKNFEAKFYIFEDIEDDYKNYKHFFKLNDKSLTPIFEK